MWYIIIGLLLLDVCFHAFLHMQKPKIYISGEKIKPEDIGSGKVVRVQRKGKGDIIMPKTDVDLAREHIMQENAKKGKDTKINELQDDYETEDIT